MISRLIVIVIIVIALGAAGVFGYQAFTTASSAVNDSAITSAGSAVLPNGPKLDFSSVKKFNKNGKLFPYPTVTPTDIGKSLNGTVAQ